VRCGVQSMPNRYPPLGPESTLLEAVLWHRKDGETIRIQKTGRPNITVYHPWLRTWAVDADAWRITLRQNTDGAELMPAPNARRHDASR
jgi:hypothetical protein